MTELQTPAQHAEPAGYGFQILERAALAPSPTNPRKRFDPAALAELAENIKGMGLAEPILVRPLPGSRLQETWTDRRPGDPAPTHEIVAGERRWRACGIAGVKQIPAMVRALTDSQVLRLQVIENLQREDLHPLEEADGYRKILDVPEDADKPIGVRIEALAREISKSTRYVYQTLQLLKLSEFPRQVFLEGKLHRTIALEVATIGNEAQQIEACRRVAGLGAKGTDVIDNPMSFREAAEYIRSNFRLLLSKAPFPIKVEFAGVGPCEACDKMSANARDLFGEGDKVPDTCMDPSCYGKKNAKHHEQLAQAAKAKGQRVITGKDAKKLLPYETSPTSFDYRADYTPLEEKRWDAAGKNEGKTVKQLLGTDMPAPVLIARPDGQGFVEALPKKDVERMLKERGLLKQRPTSVNNAQAEADRKARLIKEQRWAVATALLQALPAIPANEPQDLNLADQNGLRAHLMLPMVSMMLGALDHEGRKRVNKLLEIDEKTLPPHSHGNAVDKYLKGLDGLGVNRFIVACLVAGELHYAQYSHPSTDNLDMLCELLKVDGKKIAAAIAAEKKAAKAKKAPATKKTVATKAAGRGAKAATPPFMAPLPVSAALEAIVGAGPMPRTEIVTKLWKYVKNAGLQDKANQRMIKCDEKLKALFGQDEVSMFEMADMLKDHVGAKAATSKPSAAAAATDKAAAPAGVVDFEIGDVVRFKEGLKSAGGKNRKVSGREGTIKKKVGDRAWSVQFGPKAHELATADHTELDLVRKGAATDPNAAWPFPTTSTKKSTTAAAKKPAKKPAEDKVLAQGELTLSTGVKLSPQPAWPFPTAAKTTAVQQ
jgi:ParB/RepB/Spo0J family partition protein